MYDWTDEQKKAIETVGAPIIVSAAAGSGKTAVLVERTIRLLCDENLKIPADSLLAVTFTNDAAAQMSYKLAEEIDRRADLEPDNAWIQRQQALLRLAEITTINAFCFNLVRENLSLTEFRSGVRILEENEAAMLTDRALTEVLELEYQERPGNMENLISLFCRENDAALRRMILQLYRFLRSLPFRSLWAKKVLASLKNGAAAKEVFAAADRSAAELRSLIEGAAIRLGQTADGLEYHSAAKAVLYENRDIALAALTALKSYKREDAAKIASEISWRPLKVRQTKAEKESASAIEAEIYESAKGCYAHLKDLFAEYAEISEFSEEDVLNDSASVAESFEKLYNLCEKLDSRVYEMKIERNALDFADTELLCVSMLADCSEDGVLSRTPLAEEIVASKRYKVILIDEFQDVNSLQDVIFKAVSGGDGLKELGENVFVVGDVKQAIYRFRQADPTIFTKTREQGRSPESSVRELLLRKNFRSRPGVLSFCNYIYGALMSKEVGETDYNESEALVAGAKFEGEDEPTELILVGGENDDDLFAAEFTAVARRIRALLDEGAKVYENGVLRKCRPSDFCVLTRNNVSGSEISEIFAKCGLKILATDTSGYLKSREISVFLNLLAVVSDPMQDVPLASVALSPIMGFSDDDLAAIRLCSRENKLYKTMLSLSLGEYEAEAPLREKCKNAVALLKKLGVLASGTTLTRLIRKIYDMTDIFAIASAYEDGEQKCANLYLLLEYARAYEQSSSSGIEGFLRYIEYISRSGGDFEQALTVTESSDAVVLKTVHRSKGLEYPFVFLCQTHKRFNRTDLNAALQLNKESGAGLSFYDYSTLTKRRTAFWKFVREKNESELLSEELRLLYVAATRAKERLFLVLDFGESAIKRAVELSYEISDYKIPPAVAKKAVCAEDWLLLALMKHPGFSALRQKLDPSAYCDDGELPKIKVSSMPPEPKSYSAPNEEDILPDLSLKAELIKSFAEAPDARLTQNEAKLTVSEIVKDDALTFFPKVPSLDESLEELTAAQRGTVTHRFMQFCDFSAASADLESEIKRLERGSVFTRREAEAIDRKSVLNFFKSDIYRRLSKSPRVLREKRFIVKFEDIEVDESLKNIYRGTDGMLQGVADCLFEEEDGYVLVDYKTDRVKSLTELTERYAGQLELYKAAFDVLLDKPVKSGYIYSFRLGEGIETAK